MMQQSSMMRAMFGSVSLTSMPLFPCFAKLKGDGMKPLPLFRL
jgi:hypothetical protein